MPNYLFEYSHLLEKISTCTYLCHTCIVHYARELYGMAPESKKTGRATDEESILAMNIH